MKQGFLHRTVSAMLLTAMSVTPFASFAHVTQGAWPQQQDQVQPQPTAVAVLDNGIVYSVSHTTQYNAPSTLTVAVNIVDMDQSVSSEAWIKAEVLRRACWMETESFTPGAINGLLLETAVPGTAAMGQVYGSQIFYQIMVPGDTVESLERGFDILREVVLHPKLNDETIIAKMGEVVFDLRRGAFEGLNPYLAQEMIDHIEHITPEALRAFHADVQLPHRMLVSAEQVREIQPIADLIEEMWNDEMLIVVDPITQPSEVKEVSPAAQAIMAAQESGRRYVKIGDETYLLVGGKVVMKNPGWLDQRTNGRIVGAACYIGGALFGGALCFLNPLAGGGVVAAGAVAGTVFMAKSYDNDPTVVAEQRDTLLEQRFSQIFSNERTKEVLTPVERRNMFFAEFASEDADIRNLVHKVDLNRSGSTDILLENERAALSEVAKRYRTVEARASLQTRDLESRLKSLREPLSERRQLEKEQADNTLANNLFVKEKARLEKELKQGMAQTKSEYLAEREKLEQMKGSYNPVWIQEQYQNLNLNYEHAKESVRQRFEQGYTIEVKEGIRLAEQANEAAHKLADQRFKTSVEQVKIELRYDAKLERIDAELKAGRTNSTRDLQAVMQQIKPNQVQLNDFVIATDIGIKA